jgi:hypothetical protein
MPGRFCLLYLSISSFERFPQRSEIEPEKPSSRLPCLGNSSGDENSSQRLREAPFCFGIFLPATRSRTARRNFSRSAGLSASRLRFIASAYLHIGTPIHGIDRSRLRSSSGRCSCKCGTAYLVNLRNREPNVQLSKPSSP